MHTLYIINATRHVLPRLWMETLYKSFVRSLLDYSDVIYDNCASIDSSSLESGQCLACLFLTGEIRVTKHQTLLKEVGLVKLKASRKYHRLVYLYKIKNWLKPG